MTRELTAKLKQSGGAGITTELKPLAVDEPKKASVDEGLAANQTIADMRDQIDSLTKAKEKFKQRVEELEKEKAKQADDFAIKLKTETSMHALSSNRIEELNKSIASMTKRVK